MYAIVSPFWNTFDDIGLTYFIPEHLRDDLKLYQIVEIPLKDKIEIAVVLKIEATSDIEQSKLKSIISIKTLHVYLYDYQWKLIYWIVQHYFTLIHNAVWLFFPRNLRDKIKNEKIEKEFEKQENLEMKYDFNYDRSLTQNQESVYNQILESENNKHLLYGITGSGKTEIYIHLIQKYLDEWKQSLLLIPEIILWGQIGDRIKQVFLRRSSCDKLYRDRGYQDEVFSLNQKWKDKNSSWYQISTLLSIFWSMNHHRRWRAWWQLRLWLSTEIQRSGSRWKDIRAYEL